MVNILVTGSGGGIGAATLKWPPRPGDKVMVHARQSAEGVTAVANSETVIRGSIIDTKLTGRIFEARRVRPARTRPLGPVPRRLPPLGHVAVRTSPHSRTHSASGGSTWLN